MLKEEIKKEIINDIQDKKLIYPAEILLELLSKVNPQSEADADRKSQVEDLARLVLNNQEWITNENVVTIPKMVEYLDNGTSLTMEQIVTIADDLFTPQSIPGLLDMLNDLNNHGYVVFEMNKDKEYFGMRLNRESMTYNVYIMKIVGGEEVPYDYPASNFRQALLATFISSNLLHYLLMNLGSIDAIIHNKYIEKLLNEVLTNLK